MKLTMTGIRELDVQLQRLKLTAAKRIVRPACRKALRPIHKEIKSTSPRRTGELRRHIKLRAIKRTRRFVGARVTVDVRHGAPVEWGWKPGDGDKVPGQYFMVQVANRKRARTIEIYRQEVAMGLERSM